MFAVNKVNCKSSKYLLSFEKRDALRKVFPPIQTTTVNGFTGTGECPWDGATNCHKLIHSIDLLIVLIPMREIIFQPIDFPKSCCSRRGRVDSEALSIRFVYGGDGKSAWDILRYCQFSLWELSNDFTVAHAIPGVKYIVAPSLVR